MEPSSGVVRLVFDSGRSQSSLAVVARSTRHCESNGNRAQLSENKQKCHSLTPVTLPGVEPACHSRAVFSPMSTINLNVNGQAHTLDLDPSTPLLYALSDDLALRGPKFGCGLGQCGSCTVIVKGAAMRSW